MKKYNLLGLNLLLDFKILVFKKIIFNTYFNWIWKLIKPIFFSDFIKTELSQNSIPQLDDFN